MIDLTKLKGEIFYFNWVILDQALVSMVNFMTGLLLARLLGVEEFGKFTLIWLSVLMINSLQVALITSPMISVYSKIIDCDKNRYLGAVCLHQALWSILVTMTCAIFLFFNIRFSWIGKIEELSFSLILVVFFVQNQDFLRRVHFIKRHKLKAFVSDLISYGGQLMLLLCIHFSHYEVRLQEVFYIISFTSALAFLYSLFQLSDVEFRKTSVVEIFYRHWGMAKWMLASAVFQWSSGNVFFILTGAILGASEVGVLKVTQSLLAVLNILFQGLENLIPMKASQYMVKSGLMSMMKYIKFVSSIGFVVTVIIGTMIYIFSSEILFFFYGNKYAGLDYYVALWVLVYPFIYLGFPIRIAFRSMERTRDIFVSYLIAGSISIMIGPALIRHKGIEGALFGIIISYATIVIFLYVKLVRNVRKISTH